MKLPIQVQPVMRNASTSTFTGSGINPSSLCDEFCPSCYLWFIPAAGAACMAARAAGCNC